MKDDKVLEAYEKMIDDNNQKLDEYYKKINEGKIKDFWGKMKDDFFADLWVTGIFKAADIMGKDWREFEDREKTMNMFKEKLKKSGIKDPLLGKIIKRAELKWKK